MNLTAHASAADFLAVAEPELMRDEAKNNLILGIAGAVTEGRRYGDDPPTFLTVDEGGALVAAAIRTPPYPLILRCEEGRLDAVDLVVDHLVTADPALPGLNGEADAAGAFARRWRGRTGARVEIERRMRIYVLHEVDPPVGVPGRARRAGAADADYLVDWFRGFQHEAVPGDPPSNPREMVLRFIDREALLIWDDDGPVSMAGSSRGSRNGATVSAVYTPPAKRGNGYASACVAELSRLLLRRGASFCTLYADLSNPTSNKIYQRIGYRPMVDAVQYRFEPRGSETG